MDIRLCQRELVSGGAVPTEPNYPPRHPGRRSEDTEFKNDKNKVLAWALGVIGTFVLGLLSYLSLESKKQGEMLIRIDERTQSYVEQIKQLHDKDNDLETNQKYLTNQVQQMKIQAAAHGWKEN